MIASKTELPAVSKVTQGNETHIVVCDRQCQKAWGKENRPRVHLNGAKDASLESSDDFVFKADNEIGDAPDIPGKPSALESGHTNWCIQQCERCGTGATQQEALSRQPKFERRHYNLNDRYERVVQGKCGLRDAEIFQKVRDWSFTDFHIPAHEFAGITETELKAWQDRHKIKLSAWRIQPDPVELQRGYDWGRIRMIAHVNHHRPETPPPR